MDFPSKRQIGQAGEKAAVLFLKRKKFKILHINLRLGRLGELDIVALDQTTLAFVEVKSKMAGEVLGGFANITQAKQRKLWDLGAAYLRKYVGNHQAVRFDAVEVEFPNSNLRNPQITHLPDAFRG